jgi:hypothetical protein
MNNEAKDVKEVRRQRPHHPSSQAKFLTSSRQAFKDKIRPLKKKKNVLFLFLLGSLLGTIKYQKWRSMEIPRNQEDEWSRMMIVLMVMMMMTMEPHPPSKTPENAKNRTLVSLSNTGSSETPSVVTDNFSVTPHLVGLFKLVKQQQHQ